MLSPGRWADPQHDSSGLPLPLGCPLTNGLVHLGVGGWVGYIAGDGLSGPGAGRHSHQAAQGVEACLQDGWEGVHTAGQGSRVP
jgi:hypothetical protein